MRTWFQPDVRHLERPAEARNLAGQDAQPLVPAHLLALLKQKLLAQADADEGPVGGNLAQRLHQPGPRQVGHGLAKGAHAGQGNRARLAYALRR